MSLFDFISAMKLRQTTAKFPLARHDMCHVKTGLRYVNMTDSDYFWFAWKKKNSNSKLHVIGMPLHEQSPLFSNAVFPLQNSWIPDETKKILGPKINPPPPPRPPTKFPSPNFLVCVKDKMIWHAKKWKVTVCGSFIHRTICRIYLFSSDSLNCEASIVRAVLHQFLLKSRYHKTSIYKLYLLNFPIAKEIPWWKISKQKRNTFIILVTLTLPSPSNPRLKQGIESNIFVCAVLFGSW